MGSLIARNASALIWGRNSDTIDEINQRHTNSRYLGEIPISKKLTATTDLRNAAKEADALVLALPSQSFRLILDQVKEQIRPEVPIISLTKGIELETRMRMTEIIAELLPQNPRGVLTGPNLAKEIIAGSAAASVLAMDCLLYTSDAADE